MNQPRLMFGFDAVTILFYIAGAIAVITSIAVILQTNIVHALLYMVVSLLSVAVVFYVLGAPFAAMLEAIVYAGAIMVLFLFVIMMLNLGQHTRDEEKSWLTPEDGSYLQFYLRFFFFSW